MIELISWNVNGIRAVVRNGFTDWFSQTRPDILCLQEVRAYPEDIPLEVLGLDGYQAHWCPAERKGYSGVASLFNQAPSAAAQLGIDAFDCEGRVQILEYRPFTLINTYFPNSQDARARIDYKVEFCEAIIDYCRQLVDTGRNVVLCGDYNIAHKEIDLARPKDNEDSPGFRPEERQSMDRLLEAGFVDTFRHFNQEPGQYTWWSYRTRGRERNVGWRLDYFCVNEGLMPLVEEAGILSEVMGSDHCPVSLRLKLDPSDL